MKQGSFLQMGLLGLGLCACIGLPSAYAIRCHRLLSLLGIVTILKRKGNDHIDSPNRAKHSYRYFGLSAVNLIIQTRTDWIKRNREPREIEVMNLDPDCEAAVRRMAEIEGREAGELHDNIKKTIDFLRILEMHNGPPEVKHVPHPLIPFFRVVTLDDKIMYVSHYPHHDEVKITPSCGYDVDMIVLKKGDEHLSLFSMFQRYCDRTNELAIQHLVARAVIRAKYRCPSISLEELQNKVTDELSEFVEVTDETNQLVIDVLREFNMDDGTTP